MSTFYKIAYQVGFHPWEDLADHPPFADTLIRLIAREEGDGGPPYGRALDVGSGSGVWGIRLAQRGWDVTGVELVAKAVARARKRVAAAGVQMRIVRADVTRLRAGDVGTGFCLILNTGTFHGLTEPQRAAMGREITAVAAGRRHRVARHLRAAPARAAAAWGNPVRHRGRVPGMADHRRRSRRHRPGTDRPQAQIRRTLVPPPSQ